MNTPTRLAPFVAALATVFALAFGVGAWTAPGDEPVPSRPSPSDTTQPHRQHTPTEQVETDDDHAR
jgi:hypothetical protein